MAYNKSSTDFRSIPSEPCPLPSLDSDDESFIVIGHSLSSQEILRSEEVFTPIVTNVIEESKRLLDKEMSMLEQLSLAAEENDCYENSIGASQKGGKEPEALQDTKAKSLEKSALELAIEEALNEGLEDIKSLPSISAELSSDELQSRISEITAENIHLKDVIVQNNMSMKSQIDRIVAWQEEVQKVHQAHKEKLFEAKKCIEKLKDECIVHSLELSQMEDKVTEHNKQIFNRDEEIRTLQSLLSDREHQLLETTGNDLKQSERNVAKIKELDMELQVLKDEHAVLKAEHASLSSDDSWSEQLKEARKFAYEALVKNYSSEKEFEMFRSTAEKKEKELNDIINDLQSRLPEIEVVANARTQLTNIEIALFQAEESKAAAKCQIGQLKKRIMEQDVEIDNLKVKVSDLIVKIRQFLSEAALHNQSEKEFEMFRSTAEKKEKELNDIINDLQSRLPEIEEVANARTQLTNIQIALTQAEESKAAANCQIAQMKNRITEQDVEIDNLKDKVSELNLEIRQFLSQAALSNQNEEEYELLEDIIKEREEKLLSIIKKLHSRLPEIEEVANTRTQLANTQIALTQAEESKAAANCQIAQLKNRITEQDVEIDNLKHNVSELNQQNVQLESQAALQTQSSPTRNNNENFQNNFVDEASDKNESSESEGWVYVCRKRQRRGYSKNLGERGYALEIKSEEEFKIFQSRAEEKEKELNDIINDLRSRLPEIEEVANARTQLTNIEIALTQAEQSRAAAYSHIAQMNNRISEQDIEIDNLKHNVSELNQQNIQLESQAVNKDEIFALQTQLEVFRTDFGLEQRAKEVMKAEKEKLVEDLQNLQRRNQQLQEEIEMIRDNREYLVVCPSNSREQFTPNPSNSREQFTPNPSAPFQGRESPPPRRYACPICSLQYRSLRLLEDHFDMCVDQRT